ncbi:WG repeat-containing protein [Okeania hirsuta]|uniref:WG repeat-containing protein n=2 Tax=Okeania hirsuta TaxID=1458930 RepID=A0A3N6PG54_9CYAN|nr:WG repeat-containing protein [Okeania hirsuta]
MKNGKIGQVDRHGRTIIENKFDALRFEEGLGFTMIEGKLGPDRFSWERNSAQCYDALEVKGRKAHTIRNGKRKIIDL